MGNVLPTDPLYSGSMLWLAAAAWAGILSDSGLFGLQLKKLM